MQFSGPFNIQFRETRWIQLMTESSVLQKNETMNVKEWQNEKIYILQQSWFS